MKTDNRAFIVRILLTITISLVIGAFFILLIGESPIEAYIALVKGAFGSKLRIGTTLAGFTPLLLTSVAFAVAAKAGAFNVGVEGAVFLGALVAAYIGINWTFLPKPILLIACFLGAILTGAIWSLIPALLKVYYNVNEVTVTILANSVALYITSYFVSGPMSAGGTVSQSHPVTVTLPKIMFPSNANAGLFIALAITICLHFYLKKSKYGIKLSFTGTNSLNAEYAGMNPKKVIIYSMMISGALGGIAGCIEVLGVHGVFLNNFAVGLGTNGMLASLIVKNNLVAVPFMAFFLATLNAGAMGIQQNTNVPKSIVDTIIAIFILIATMDGIIAYVKNRRLKKTNKTEVTR